MSGEIAPDDQLPHCHFFPDLDQTEVKAKTVEILQYLVAGGYSLNEPITLCALYGALAFSAKVMNPSSALARSRPCSTSAAVLGSRGAF